MITEWVARALQMTNDWDTCHELWRDLRWARRREMMLHWYNREV